MTLQCADCGADLERDSGAAQPGGSGFGVLDGRKLCYACCAKHTRADMIRTGKALLYFTYGASDAAGPVNASEGRKPEITNWPGTLKFSARNVRRFRHPFAREAWLGEFTGPDGKLWRFKNIGDTQIAHCRRASA